MNLPRTAPVSRAALTFKTLIKAQSTLCLRFNTLREASAGWEHAAPLRLLEFRHPEASSGARGEVLGLRCLYKQCLCIDIPGYCRRIKALSLMFKSAANAPCHLACEGLWEWFRGRKARLHISHVSARYQGGVSASLSPVITLLLLHN